MLGGKNLYYIKRVSHLRNSTSIQVTPELFTKKLFSGFLHLLQNYLFSLLFTQTLSKVTISVSGRKTCLI